MEGWWEVRVEGRWIARARVGLRGWFRSSGMVKALG